MIDISSIKYYVVAVDSAGTKTEITDFISKLSWSEAKKQLSMKITATGLNEKNNEGHLSEMVEPGTLIIIMSTVAGVTMEVARGKVEVWNPVTDNEDRELNFTCYDDLYPFQKSQDNYIVKKNWRGYKAIKKLFKKWKIPQGNIGGPSVKLPKMIFQKRYIGDIVTAILEKAHEKGDDKYLMHVADGVIDIVPYFDNADIYCFNEDNSIRIDEKHSTEDLVTRVAIYDKENKKMKAKIDGLTDFGIRQTINTMEDGQSLKDAKKVAQQVIDEKGVIEKTIKLKTPDIPFLRKGDVVHVDIETSVGYFDVIGVSHEAESVTMTISLEYSDKNEVIDGNVTRKKKYVKGDIVYFLGGEYHMSAKASSKSFWANAGKAKIAKVSKKKAFPYRLVHTNVASTINGYVTADQFY